MKQCDCTGKSRVKLKALSNKKNGGTEDRRETIIRDEADKESVCCVFACTSGLVSHSVHRHPYTPNYLFLRFRCII